MGSTSVYYFPCDTLIAYETWLTVHLEEPQVPDVDSATGASVALEWLFVSGVCSVLYPRSPLMVFCHLLCLQDFTRDKYRYESFQIFLCKLYATVF